MGSTSSSPVKPDPKAELAKKTKKPRLDLLPPVALLYMADALESGAQKYGEFNWRETGAAKLAVNDYGAAILRHTLALMDGEFYDSETGLPHLAHIMAGAAIALDADTFGRLNAPEFQRNEAYTMALGMRK